MTDLILTGPPSHRFAWHDRWAALPDGPLARNRGQTHGVGVARDGSVFVFRQAFPSVLRFDVGGQLIASWGEFPGAHSLTIVAGEDGGEQLWLTDSDLAIVALMTLDGRAVRTLSPPDDPARGPFMPTWVASAGDGDVWVTDGYGQSKVHRYDREGRVTRTLTGEEGAGRFKCPHAVWVGQRKGGVELYVTDRGNHRLAIYASDGTFKRVACDAGELIAPSSFAATPDGHLAVTELNGRVSLLDADDRVVARLGDNVAIAQVFGWPNVPAERIEPGKFNSPHGIASDAAGNLYVAEWTRGGRVTKLTRA